MLSRHQFCALVNNNNNVFKHEINFLCAWYNFFIFWIIFAVLCGMDAELFTSTYLSEKKTYFFCNVFYSFRSLLKISMDIIFFLICCKILKYVFHTCIWSNILFKFIFKLLLYEGIESVSIWPKVNCSNWKNW